MARAFSIFANQGRSVTPIAIRSVEDRNGRVVLDPERDLRLEQRRQGNEMQVISPQNAFVMTNMLKKTVELGTLYNPSGWGSKFTFKDENGKTFKMPMAGKTGTPQNWSDAWTVGFSPYYTTAIWFGFDKPGNSLGVTLTGSTLAGPVWADYMREIHQGLPYKDFVRPTSGIIDVTVCAKSGLLKTAACNQGEVTLPFLLGTQPELFCNIHGNTGAIETNLERLRLDTVTIDDNEVLRSLTMPTLPPDFVRELNSSSSSNRNTSPSRTSPTTTSRTTTPSTSSGSGTSSSSQNPPVTGNPFLDGTPPAAEAQNEEGAPYIPGGDAPPAGGGLELPSYNPLLD
jgi:penicillin-binding protein 1A